jgi:hypothetical protein
MASALIESGNEIAFFRTVKKLNFWRTQRILYYIAKNFRQPTAAKEK